MTITSKTCIFFIMVKKNAIVKSQYGIHARPSMAIAIAAQKFPNTVIRLTDTDSGNESDAKSILGIMSMGTSCGSKIIINASGNDEDSAAATIAELIESYEVDIK